MSFALRREPALHAIVVYAATLFCGAYYLLTVHPRRAWAPAADVVTLLWWITDGVRYSPATPRLCAAAFALCLVVLPLRPVLAAWGAGLAYLGGMSVCLESWTFVDHTLQLTALVLVYAAAAITVERQAIAACPRRELWRTALAPAWFIGLSRLAVGGFYMWSGLGKLTVSGLGWANGLSLQLWVLAFGSPGSHVGGWLVEHREAARFLQAAVLALELAALPALAFKATRVAVGVGLIAFHLGQQILFGWAFHANTALLALLYLPVDEWCRAAAARSAPTRS